MHTVVQGTQPAGVVNKESYFFVSEPPCPLPPAIDVLCQNADHYISHNLTVITNIQQKNNLFFYCIFIFLIPVTIVHFSITKEKWLQY